MYIWILDLLLLDKDGSFTNGNEDDNPAMGDQFTETIFTKHNQTVIPLLANNKKVTLQAIHTSFANAAIENMTDNIQGSWEIDHQLYCTCLEYKPTRYKLHKHSIYTERGSENCH